MEGGQSLSRLDVKESLRKKLAASLTPKQQRDTKERRRKNKILRGINHTNLKIVTK